MKSVYTGGEKVAEFEDYSELRVGDSKPAFIYEGNELVYPAPVKDGLVLWYDFSGRTNADSQRGIAEDLSGNGNHGTLQNFNYTPESGYDKNKLLFDGVDDRISILHNSSLNPKDITVELSLKAIHTDNLQSVISKRSHISNGYNLFILGSGSIYFDWGGGGVNRWTISNAIDFGNLMTLTITHKENSTIFYVKGVKVREISRDLVMEHSDTDLLLGLDQYTKSYPFLGEFLGLKIYNRPLSPEEIAHNYEIEKERFDIE